MIKNKKNHSYYCAKHFRRGFSLLEAVIALAVFSIVMVSIVMVFSSSMGAFRKAKSMEKNIEDARYTMNYLAKTFSMSEILDNNSAYLKIYDFSEAKCKFFSYYVYESDTFVDNFYETPISEEDCVNEGTIIWKTFANSYSRLKFYLTQTDPPNLPITLGKMGKNTIQIKVCSNAGCAGPNNDQVILQTTVSFRDYKNAGVN